MQLYPYALAREEDAIAVTDFQNVRGGDGEVQRDFERDLDKTGDEVMDRL